MKTCISFSRLDPYAEKAAHHWHILGLEKTGIKFKKKKKRCRQEWFSVLKLTNLKNNIVWVQ